MATNKRLLISESPGDLNRCIPCRGNLTNTAHASHTQPVYGPRPYVSHRRGGVTWGRGGAVVRRDFRAAADLQRSAAASQWYNSPRRKKGSLDSKQSTTMSQRQSWTEPLLPRKRNSWLHLQHVDWPIYGSPSSLSPTLNQRISGESQASIDNRLLGLSGPYL
jgi:hypothetical protein